MKVRLKNGEDYLVEYEEKFYAVNLEFEDNKVEPVNPQSWISHSPYAVNEFDESVVTIIEEEIKKYLQP